MELHSYKWNCILMVNIYNRYSHLLEKLE